MTVVIELHSTRVRPVSRGRRAGDVGTALDWTPSARGL